MSIFDFFRRPVESKASIGQAQMVVGRDHSYALSDWKAYAKEGYALNPSVYACIDLIATSFARVPLKVYNDEGEELTEGPLVELLDQPNPDEGGDEFRTSTVSWLLLTGNTFTERILAGGVPTELWNWQPYDMSVGRVKGSRLPARYTWRKGLEGQQSWDVNIVTGESDIMHWRKFNPDPSDSTFGQSPMAAAAASADSYNSAMKLRYNKMKNGLSIDGILSPDSGDSNMDHKQQSELERKIREKYTGVDGLRVAVSNTKMSFTTMTSTLRDAEWGFGTKLNKQEICEVFKVPTQLLGIEGSQTFANYAEANKAFYYHAVIPLLELYCSEMNRWLGEFFPGQTISWSKSDIDALETDRSAFRTEMIQAGVFTINEIREAFGKDPVDDEEANVVMTDPSKIPLGMDVFGEGEEQAEEVAKSLMRAGMPRAEAEQKSLEWFYDRKD